MTETVLARILDSGVSLAILVWMLQIGQKQMQTMYTDHKATTQTLIDSLMERNKHLSDTLISCISAASQPCKDKD